MSLTVVTLTGTFKDAAGNVAAGTLELTPIVPFSNTGSNVVVNTETVTVTLNGSGQIPAATTIYATDDSDTTPDNVRYRVKFKMTGAQERTHEYEVPASSPGATVDFSDLTPVTSPNPVATYATVAALNGIELDDLADVSASSPSDDQVLTFDSGTSTWGPATPSAGSVDYVSNVAADRVLGRISSGSGNSEELTAAQVITLLGLAALYQPLDSDLTAIAALSTTSFGRSLLAAADAAALRTLADSPSNAEAVLDSLFDANTILKADSDNTPEALTVAEQTLVGRLTGGEIAALSATDVRTLLDVPTNAQAILDTLVDAKGDLIVGTAADTPARLAVGSNGALLVGDSTATPGVAWVSEFSVGGTSVGMASGRYYFSTLPNSTSLAMTQDLAIYVPVWFGRACTLDRIGVAVSTNIASSVIRLGLYTSSAGLPTTLVADFGTVSSASTGAKEITVNQAVNGGLYWVAVVNQTAGGVVLRGSAGNYGYTAVGASDLTAYASGTQITFYTQSSVSGALGSTASVNGTGTGAAPSVTVRAA